MARILAPPTCNSIIQVIKRAHPRGISRHIIHASFTRANTRCRMLISCIIFIRHAAESFCMHCYFRYSTLILQSSTLLAVFVINNFCSVFFSFLFFFSPIFVLFFSSKYVFVILFIFCAHRGSVFRHLDRTGPLLCVKIIYKIRER